MSFVRRFQSILILVVAHLLAVTTVFSQIPNGGGKENRNAIGLTVSLNEFFDGNRLWQQRVPRTLRWVNLTYGLEYDRKLSALHGFTLALKLTEIHSYSPNLLYGQTFERAHASLDAYYRRRILSSNRTNLYGTLGFNFRYGNETVFYHQYFNESIIHAYDLRDFGILAGGRITHALSSRLVLSSELRFIEYFYRYAAHQPRYPEEFPNRPTRHLLSLQVGLGYQF